MLTEYSAGGLVIKIDKNKKCVLLVKHAKYGHWSFPKGHIGDSVKDETKEEAAVRETKEETGIDAVITYALKPIMYRYTFNGQKRKKTVYYFCMEYVGGDFSQKDHEMELVEWVDFDQVEQQLSFDGEKNAWNEALEYLSMLENTHEVRA